MEAGIDIEGLTKYHTKICNEIHPIHIYLGPYILSLPVSAKNYSCHFSYSS